MYCSPTSPFHANTRTELRFVGNHAIIFFAVCSRKSPFTDVFCGGMLIPLIYTRGDDSWAYLSLNIARGHERDDLLRQWDQEMKDGLPPNELLNCLLEVARSMVVR